MTLPRKPLIAIALAAACIAPALGLLVPSYLAEGGDVPLLGLPGGIACGVLGALSIAVLRRALPALAAYPSMVVGLLLAAKPWLAPVMLPIGGPGPFPPFSETHLYFIVPGAALLAAGFSYLLRVREG